MSAHPHQLREVVIGDRPEAWAAAGFAIDGDTTVIGSTRVRLIGDHTRRGIRSAALDDITGHIDGLTFREATGAMVGDPPVHPNGVGAIDHLVATSPDVERTVAALTARGIEHRRTRTFEVAGRTRRQAFFWMGDVILELAGDDPASGDGPAILWGLALVCPDLDAAAAALGDRLGRIKPAVQPGRRIATLRTADLDISVPVALMSPHVGAGPDDRDR